jgi:ABC-2 type transport system ATP-binding protein
MTCDRITIINRGKIVATDTPANLTSRLAGEGVYDLEIEGDPSEAQTLLRRLPAVRQVTLQQGDRPPYQLRVWGSADPHLGPSLANTLVNAGLQLRELHRQQASLEEVFLNLTTTEALAEPLPTEG